MKSVLLHANVTLDMSQPEFQTMLFQSIDKVVKEARFHPTETEGYALQSPTAVDMMHGLKEMKREMRKLKKEMRRYKTRGHEQVAVNNELRQENINLNEKVSGLEEKIVIHEERIKGLREEKTELQEWKLATEYKLEGKISLVHICRTV